jgi:molybdate transport system substrate-binding protein
MSTLQKIIGSLLLIVGLAGALNADAIKVFVTPSAKLAMTEIVGEFKKSNPNDEIIMTFSATGKAYQQLINGMDYDIFMAADSKHPKKIVADAIAISKPEIYAFGVIALYSNDKELIKQGINALKNDKVKHISITNPKVAPYGVAAMEILASYGLTEVVASKIVMGDNMGQSVQFVDSGAADIGLVAYSLLKETQPNDKYMVIDSSRYKSMEQSFVLTKYAKNKALAVKFGKFITSQNAKNIFKKYGFGIK